MNGNTASSSGSIDIRRYYIFLICIFLACTVCQAQTPRWAEPRLVGLVRDTRLTEISGSAASRRVPNRYWVHNDSGNRGEIFAIDTQGNVHVHLRIDGVKKLIDPEDIASFELDGKSYLLLADTGDNGGKRKSVEILVIEEPLVDAAEISAEIQVAPAWRIRFHYADAPHDVEAVAVDAQRREILLLTKRTDPPELWALPLHPVDGVELIAEPRGAIAVPASSLANATLPRLSPTALDIAPDNSAAYVLTYREVWHYPRQHGESWAHALARAPEVLPFALVPQAEALSLARDGQSFYVTGEHWPAPIIEFAIPAGTVQ